jgi:acyl-CoA thioesterase
MSTWALSSRAHQPPAVDTGSADLAVCCDTQWSPVAAVERGLCFGHIYDQAGVMVASTSQEGLMRVVPEDPQSSGFRVSQSKL